MWQITGGTGATGVTRKGSQASTWEFHFCISSHPKEMKNGGGASHAGVYPCTL